MRKKNIKNQANNLKVFFSIILNLETSYGSLIKDTLARFFFNKIRKCPAGFIRKHLETTATPYLCFTVDKQKAAVYINKEI